MHSLIKQFHPSHDNFWPAVQTVIIFLTFVGVVLIGVRQNHINQQLVDLQFFPSVTIVFEPGSRQLYVYNQGDKNIYIGGVKFDDKFSQNNSVDLFNDLREISPGHHYYFLASEKTDRMLENYFEELEGGGDAFIEFDVGIQSLSGRKYRAKNILLLKLMNGQRDIHTQTTSIVLD